MGRYENDSRNKNNFQDELMKVYGHCFENNCYGDRYHNNNNDKYEKCDNHKDDRYDKCDNHKDDRYDKCDNKGNKEKEIKQLLKFIFAELDNIECDLEKIEKALKRLFNLLDDDCSCNDNKDDFKCVMEDLKVLNYFINKTKKDIKCLAKKAL